MVTVFTAHKPEAAASRLVGVFLGEGSSALCSTAAGSRSTQLLYLVQGSILKFFSQFFTGMPSEIFEHKLILCDVSGFFSMVLLL